MSLANSPIPRLLSRHTVEYSCPLACSSSRPAKIEDCSLRRSNGSSKSLLLASASFFLIRKFSQQEVAPLMHKSLLTFTKATMLDRLCTIRRPLWPITPQLPPFAAFIFPPGFAFSRRPNPPLLREISPMQCHENAIVDGAAVPCLNLMPGSTIGHGKSCAKDRNGCTP